MIYSFSSLKIDANLVSSLSRVGIIAPSSIQYHFIKSSADEISIIFQSKSGTGKTVSLCILLLNKILTREKLKNDYLGKYSDYLSHLSEISDFLSGDVVIIVPTSELAYQIYLFFLSLTTYLKNINPLILSYTNKVSKVVECLYNNKYNIIISTPGRFKSVLKNKSSTPDNANVLLKSNNYLFKTHLLIFDEADLLLDEHFYQQTSYICSKIVTPFVQVISSSATFTKPQLKSFEDMIDMIDLNYIDKLTLIKDNVTKIEDLVVVDPRLSYHLEYLYLKDKIATPSDFFKYLSSFERNFLKIIISTSYLNRVLNPNTSGLDRESFYITTDATEGIVDVDDDSTSLVLDKVDFYMASVPDAPNIVMQIGLKVDVIVKVLCNVDYKKCIIFCNQGHTRIQTYKILQSLGFACYVNSSRASHNERIKMLYDLSCIDKVIILCTDVMSRGIGISNVDLVINMDIPGSKEVFLHRSGRSGRFGAQGICLSICMESEVETYSYFMYSLNFESLPVEKLYTNDVNPDVSKIMNSCINFMNLSNTSRNTSRMFNPSLVSTIFNSSPNKLKISIVGYVFGDDIKIFSEFSLFCLETNGPEVLASIEERHHVSHTLFDLKASKIVIYTERIIEESNNIRHIALQIGESRLLLSLPLHELEKILRSSWLNLDIITLNKSTTECKIPFEELKSVLNKPPEFLCNISNEDELSSLFSDMTLYSKSIKNEVVKWFLESTNATNDYKAVIYLYIIVSEKLHSHVNTTSNLEKINPCIVKDYFMSKHISKWSTF